MDESTSSDNGATDIPSTNELPEDDGSTAKLPVEPADNSETKSASPSEIAAAAGTSGASFTVDYTKTAVPCPVSPIPDPNDAPGSPLIITLNDSAGLSETNRIPPSRLPVADEKLQAGDKLGHFVITRFIGQGGMGRVYEAKDTVLDRPVAIKVLYRHQAQDRGTVDRFLNEARLAARLNHEHIAQVYYFGTEGEIPYIAFEFVEGENLRKYVDEHGTLSVESSVIFLMQIADALVHANNNGVTHRDVKPSNIIITPQQKAKLIDMGLARAFHADNSEDELTVSGVMLGTFDYMSPEQAFKPRDADVRSDIYSLGCTFFFMLSGHPPYSNMKDVQKLILHQQEETPDIRQQVPEVPESVSAILQKMMRKNPDDRYQTPEELIADLRSVGEQLGLFLPEGGVVSAEPVPGETTAVEGDRWNLRRVFAYYFSWILGVLAFLAVCGAVLLFDLYRSRSFENDVENLVGKSPFFIQPAAAPQQNDSPDEVLAGTLPPSFLGMRRRPFDQAFGDMNRSEELTASSNVFSREFGGIGIAPIASSDIMNEAKTANLSEEGMRLLETTVDPLFDAASTDWSTILPTGGEGEKKYNDGGVSFREGADSFVDRKGKKDGYFATLNEAVASFNAWNQSIPPSQRHELVLRLAFDGDMDVSHLALSDCSLRLVPAAGYSPRLVFRPDSATEEEDASLFSLRNASLSMAEISLFLDVTDQHIISDSWTMFRFDTRSTLSLENVKMVIKNCEDAGNLYHPNTAFFRLAPAAAASPSTAIAADGESSETSSAAEGNLFISKGVYQGEAALLMTPGGLPLKFDVEQGVFIIDGSFVQCDIKRRLEADRTTSARRCNLSIRESFVWCRSPLLRIVSSSALSPSNGLGKEIHATINKSFVASDGNPFGEYVLPGSGGEKEISPLWKMSQNLFADLSVAVEVTDPLGSSDDEAGSPTEKSSIFGNDNIFFEISPPKLPFWKISREETEGVVFNAARKNLESEIARLMLENLVKELASGESGESTISSVPPPEEQGTQPPF